MRHKTAIKLRRAVLAVPEKQRKTAYRALKRFWHKIPHNHKPKEPTLRMVR